MCTGLKFNAVFKKMGISIDKSRNGEFYFYLPKKGEKYRLKFHKSQEEGLINSGLLKYKLLKGYEAIYSPIKRNIECQLTGMNSTEYENLCHYISDYNPVYSDESDMIELPPIVNLIYNSFDVKLFIGYCSKAFQTLLKCKHPIHSINNNIFSLTISDTDINSHQEALEKLTKFGLSVLFSISSKLHINLNLLNDQPRSNYRWFENFDEESAMLSDAELPNIKNIYKFEPLSYYLNANVCDELPFYQFLQYYHCFEYFFPECRVMRNNSNLTLVNKTNCLRSLINFVLKFLKKKKFGGELEDLNYLFSKYFEEKKLYDYIKTYSVLRKYYFETNNYNKLSKFEIKHSKSISLKKLAKRFYKIRNAIVHSKSDENRIEPNEENFVLLRNDIKLVKYMVEQLLKKTKLKST